MSHGHQTKLANVQASSKCNYSHSRLCFNSPIGLPLLFSVSNITNFPPHEAEDTVREEGPKLGACGMCYGFRDISCPA